MTTEVQKTEAARLSVSLGAKLNIGNYESISLNFTVTDSARQGETVDQAFDRIYAKVEQKLVAKSAEVREEVNS